MIAKVSVCLIVKNEPLLEECINSFRDHVAELVIIDTGSNDGITQEIAKKYADIFEIYTDCNDPETGLINDFSQARQRSFDLATQPWTMWVDADDIIIGLDKLQAVIDSFDPIANGLDAVGFLFPYEYSYDAEGNCTCRHYRERLFSNKNHFRWVNAVHEVAVPLENSKISLITSDDIVIKHRRQFGTKMPEIGRNLRILQNYFENNNVDDARQFYYYGLELANAGLIDEAINKLIKYIEISGWDEERVQACLKLIEIYQAKGNYEEGLKWAMKAVLINETWGEGYLAAAKMFYFLAMNGGPNEKRNWERCVYFAKTGLSFPPTKTLLFINPLERECEIHKYLNMALNKLGDVQGALDSVNTGIKKQPSDPNFINNKRLYEAFLARNDTVTAINKLKNTGEIEQKDVETISAIINKQPIPNQEIIKSSITTIKSDFALSEIWKIPSIYDFSTYPLKLSTEQLQAVVMMIWKQYMLHDEVLSAISFLEKAPYSVRHTFATEKALKLTKACLDWMDDKQEFQTINAPANTEVEAGNPLPNKLIWSEGHRFDLVANHLPPNSTIVDFGCSTGGYTNRYGMLGHKAVGLDACESSIKVAQRKATEFQTGAEFICTMFQEAVGKVPNEYYDYAVSTDTYEHLKDPVNDMFIPAKQMLKKDGKFLLATPYGAWMRGEFFAWAHPWLFEKEGKSWLDPFPRAHLIAPTAWSVAENFRKAGYWVKDCYPDLCGEYRDVEGQGNIFAEAHLQAPKNEKPLDIVFFGGDAPEIYTPKSFLSTGLGGSETMLVENSKRLASLGHKVRVYAGIGEHGEGIYDGVEWRQTNKYQDLNCDVLIVSRRADMLADQYNIQAKLRFIWVHDLFPININANLILKCDRILTLSQFHKNFILSQFNYIHPDQILVTRNGIDLNKFDKKIKRDKFKCINASSPDRSYPILLNCWKEIKKQVPEATLHLYYGFGNWEYSAQFYPGQPELIERLKLQIKEMESLGVVFHDRINQDQLAEEFLSAGVLGHPTFFAETSGITFMNAQMAGLQIISSTIGALNETVGERGVLISGDWTSSEYQENFIKEVVKAMQKEEKKEGEDIDRLKLQQYAKEHFCLDKLARDWEKIFFELIESKKIDPIIPYISIKYR